MSFIKNKSKVTCFIAVNTAIRHSIKETVLVPVLSIDDQEMTYFVLAELLMNSSPLFSPLICL